MKSTTSSTSPSNRSNETTPRARRYHGFRLTRTDYSTAGDSTGRISGPPQNTGGTMTEIKKPWHRYAGGRTQAIAARRQNPVFRHGQTSQLANHAKASQQSQSRGKTESEDISEQDNMTSSLNQTQTTGAFDTQAIAAIAAADFGRDGHYGHRKNC